MAAEDGGVTDGRTNLIPDAAKDGSWHQHAGKHAEPSLFSLNSFSAHKADAGAPPLLIQATHRNAEAPED